jgi:hypothetical protein
MKQNYYKLTIILFMLFLTLNSYDCAPPGSSPKPPPSEAFPLRLGGSTNIEEMVGSGCGTDGTVIIAGLIMGNADLDGDGIISASPPETDNTSYSHYDTFITKFDASGSALWIKRLGSFTGKVQGESLAVDTAGNVIVVGSIDSHADLDGDGIVSPGMPETRSAFFAYDDIFISKFEADGDFLWAKRLGGPGGETCYNIAIDSLNNIIIVGNADYRFDFNGDEVIDPSWPETHGSYYEEFWDDIFVIKLNPDGDVLWYKRLGGADPDYGLAVAADGNNNVIVTGWIEGDADLSGDGNISAGLPETAASPFDFEDAFIAKFNSGGGYQWAKRIGGAAPDDGQTITADSSGNIYVGGDIIESADFNGDGVISPGFPETSGSPYGYRDAFLARYDSSGTLQWVKRMGGLNNDGVKDITLQGSGNIVITGFVEGTRADLNGDGVVSPGMPETRTPDYGDYDIYFTVFDSSGNCLHSKRLGGVPVDVPENVCSDSSGNYYITGKIHGDADLDGDYVITIGLPETQAAPFQFGDIFISQF